MTWTKKERRKAQEAIRLNTYLKGEIKEKFIELAEELGLEYSSNNSVILAIINMLHRKLK